MNMNLKWMAGVLSWVTFIPCTYTKKFVIDRSTSLGGSSSSSSSSSSGYHRVGPLVDQIQSHTPRNLWNDLSWLLSWEFEVIIWHNGYGDGSDSMWICLSALHYFRLTHKISVCRVGAATFPTDMLNGKKTHMFAGSPPGSTRTSVCTMNLLRRT